MCLLLSYFQHNFIHSILIISFSSVRCSSKMAVNSAISSSAWRALSLSTKGRAYKVQFFSSVVRPGQFESSMLVIFDSDYVRFFLHVRRREWVPTVKLRHRLRFTRTPEQFFSEEGPADSVTLRDVLHTTPHVARANWRPTEERRRGTPLRASSLRLHTK